MEQYHLVHKVSRFFPSSFTSSCKSNQQIPADVVVESSINPKKSLFPRNKAIQTFPNATHNKKSSPSMIKSCKGSKTLYRTNDDVFKASRYSHHKKSLPLGSGVEEGRKCPPVNPLPLKKKEQVIKSSSSNSGRWFSSTTTDDDEAGLLDGKSDANFFSFSSCSSESFRQRVLTQSRRHDLINSKIFSDFGRCSSALSAQSVNKVLMSQCGRDKKAEKQETCLEKIIMENDEAFKGAGCKDLTELYYGGSQRRKKAGGRKNGKKIRRRRKRETIMRAAAAHDHHNLHHNLHYDDGENENDLLVEDSYAVEKSSSDPYGDFRTSMVEMIMEKQIFGSKDLQKLLDCFVSLNSPCYHSVIVEVFMEICDTLFGVNYYYL